MRAASAVAQSTISQPNAYLLFPELNVPGTNPVAGKQLAWVKPGVGWCTMNSAGTQFCPGGGGGGGYSIVQDEGVNLTSRSTLNFIGAGVTCVDNAGATRTDCTIPGGGGGGTVTSVDCIAGLTCTPDPIVGAGTIGIGTGQVVDTMLADNYSGIGACAASKWVSTLNDDAAPTCTQPAFSDISGSATDAQVPNILTLDLPSSTLTGITDDAVLVGSGVGTSAYKALPSCSTSASALNYTTGTNTWSCNTAVAAATTAAFASNPGNCGAGLVAAGIDASGVAEGCVDHGGLGGLADDDHAQYLLLAGRTGTTNDPIISTSATGTIAGSNNASGKLVLKGTTSGTPGTIDLPNPTRVGDSGTATKSLEVTTATAAASGGATETLDVTGTLTVIQDSLLDMCPAGLTIGNGGGVSSFINSDNCAISLTADNSVVGSGFITFLGADPIVSNTATPITKGSAITGVAFAPGVQTGANNTPNNITLNDGICPAETGLCFFPITQASRSGTATVTIQRASAVVSGVSGSQIGPGSTVTDYNTTYTRNPAKDASATITNLIAHDIEDLTSGGTNISLRSAGASVTMRHAGSGIFGSSSTAPAARLDIRQANGSNPAVKAGYNDANFGSGADTRDIYRFNDTVTMPVNGGGGSTIQNLDAFTVDPTVTMTSTGLNDLPILRGLQFTPTVTMGANGTFNGMHLGGTYTNSATPVIASFQGIVADPLIRSQTSGVAPYAPVTFLASATTQYDVGAGTGAVSANHISFQDGTTLQTTTAGGTMTVTRQDSFVSAPNFKQTAGTLTVTTRDGFRCADYAKTNTPGVTDNVCIEVGSMANATNNMSLRSTGTQHMRHAGSVMIGTATAAPSALLHLQQQTAGSEVQRVETVETTSNPLCSTFQKRLTCTGGGTATFDVASATGFGYSIDARVVERCTGGTNCGTVAVHEFHARGAFTNNSGTLTNTGNETTTLAGNVTGAAAGNVAFSASGTNMRTTVTCQTSVNATWGLLVTACQIGG